jgi:hypothetical protein
MDPPLQFLTTSKVKLTHYPVWFLPYASSADRATRKVGLYLGCRGPRGRPVSSARDRLPGDQRSSFRWLLCLHCPPCFARGGRCTREMWNKQGKADTILLRPTISCAILMTNPLSVCYSAAPRIRLSWSTHRVATEKVHRCNAMGNQRRQGDAEGVCKDCAHGGGVRGGPHSASQGQAMTLAEEVMTYSSRPYQIL